MLKRSTIISIKNKQITPNSINQLKTYQIVQTRITVRGSLGRGKPQTKLYCCRLVLIVQTFTSICAPKIQETISMTLLQSQWPKRFNHFIVNRLNPHTRLIDGRSNTQTFKKITEQKFTDHDAYKINQVKPFFKQPQPQYT